MICPKTHASCQESCLHGLANQLYYCRINQRAEAAAKIRGSDEERRKRADEDTSYVPTISSSDYYANT
jgi:hypothetical protein